jgi:hypothetical protein
LTILDNFLASLMLSWKTGSRIQCRAIPVTGTGYFQPANDGPEFPERARMAPGSTGQLIAARSCSYSELNLGGARSA